MSGQPFTLFPAIDLRRGRCVRLRQGDPNAETVYSEDPVAMARHWVAQGATWLHVVNLDGAFTRDARAAAATHLRLADLPINLQRLAAIAAAVDVPIQFGGGLRTLEDIELALNLGATRVVLGTVAVTNPALVRDALQRFGPERIVVGLDARDGRIATHGWLAVSDVSAVELGRAMREAGVQRAVYTDIRRDGMLTGVDVAGTAHLAEATGLRVIASGGVASLDDIDALLAVAHKGVEGVIIGQALYTGRVDLRAALERVRLHRSAPSGHGSA